MTFGPEHYVPILKIKRAEKTRSTTSPGSCRILIHCPRLEPDAHGIGDLVDVETFADPLPHDSTGFAANPPRRAVSIQQTDRLIGPQEFDQRARISSGVPRWTAYRPESKLPAIDPGMQHPPPRRKETARGRQEPIAHHQRGPIQNLPVDVDLIVQPAQAVSIRLDLVAVQQTVHHGDVDPHAAAAQPQLLDDGRCGILTVFFAEPDPQSRTNGRISQTLRSLPQTAGKSNRAGVSAPEAARQTRTADVRSAQSWPRNRASAPGARSSA